MRSAERLNNSQTWIRRCVNYWSTKIGECGFGVDWADACIRCWRCGYSDKSLQKCHIIPRSLGGSSRSNNLIPLCSRCHDEAPDCVCKDEMFDWIRDTRCPLYDTFWFARALWESNVLPPEDVDKEAYTERYEKAINQVAIHFGQNSQGAYIKTSSLAWALRKAAGPNAIDLRKLLKEQYEATGGLPVIAMMLSRRQLREIGVF